MSTLYHGVLKVSRRKRMKTVGSLLVKKRVGLWESSFLMPFCNATNFYYNPLPKSLAENEIDRKVKKGA